MVTESVLGFTTFALFPPSLKLNAWTASPLESNPEFSEYAQADAQHFMDSNHYLLNLYSKHIDYSDYKMVHLSFEIQNHTWLRKMHNVQLTFKPFYPRDYLYYTNEAVLIDINKMSYSEYGLSIAMTNEAYLQLANKKLPATLTLSWGYGNSKEFKLDQLLK